MAPVTDMEAATRPATPPAVPPHANAASAPPSSQPPMLPQRSAASTAPTPPTRATPPTTLPPMDTEAPLSAYVYNILACQLCSAATTAAKERKDCVNTKALTSQPCSDHTRNVSSTKARSNSDVAADATDRLARNPNNKNQRLSGVAFDIVLKPASSPSPPKSKALSPLWGGGVAETLDNRAAAADAAMRASEVERRPGAGNRRSRPISAEIIDCKLKAAEERRMNLELDRLNLLAEQRERARDAVARMVEEHASWSRAAAERHSAKMEMMEGNRMEQLASLQERLREHEQHIENVRKASEFYAQMVETRVARKMEEAEQKREEHKREKLKKLAEHERHCEEVRRNKEKLEESRQLSPLDVPMKSSQEVSG